MLDSCFDDFREGWRWYANVVFQLLRHISCRIKSVGLFPAFGKGVGDG